MTDQERMELLRNKCGEFSQAIVALKIDYSKSAVNQALAGKYKGSLNNLLKRVEEVFSQTTVECPVMGGIFLKQCAENRRDELRVTNPLRVKLYRECPSCTAWMDVQTPAEEE